MIVVDTNIIAYALLGGPESVDARAALVRDPEWAAPTLWRSELRHVLVRLIRYQPLSRGLALEVFADAERLVGARESSPDSRSVIDLAVESGCTAYDCEFVALAQERGALLVTADRQLLKAFPGVAVSLSEFLKAG